jgi:hypothetical protein
MFHEVKVPPELMTSTNTVMTNDTTLVMTPSAHDEGDPEEATRTRVPMARAPILLTVHEVEPVAMVTLVTEVMPS